MKLYFQIISLFHRHLKPLLHAALLSAPGSGKARLTQSTLRFRVRQTKERTGPPRHAYGIETYAYENGQDFF